MVNELFYKEFNYIETKRLVIRKFDISDVDDYFSFASNPEVTKYLRWNPHQNKDFTLNYLREVLHKYQIGSDTPWGIELKQTKKIIGTVHVMNFDNFHKKAHVGIVISKEYWNKGYAFETLTSIFNYCFVEFELNRIEAYCISANEKAIKLCEWLGMFCEGELRQYAIQKGEFQDFKLYSLLSSDHSYEKV